jgi:hypothetical protein
LLQLPLVDSVECVSQSSVDPFGEAGMAADVVFECDADDIDARVNVGVGVLVITTKDGRAIVSASEEVLERLILRIRMALDSTKRR